MLRLLLSLFSFSIHWETESAVLGSGRRKKWWYRRKICFQSVFFAYSQEILNRTIMKKKGKMNRCMKIRLRLRSTF